jgi:hypothetical protein
MKAAVATQGELSALLAIKRGEDVDVTDAEFLAARLQSEVRDRAACQKCHACISCIPARSKPMLYMAREKAMAKIKQSDATCLENEALMAVAMGKKGSALFALHEACIGFTVRV